MDQKVEHSALATALSAAVPLWVMQFKTMPLDVLQKIAKESSDMMLQTREAILFKTKPGESAKAFNALARGIAVLSFSPGGVRCFGMHFESVHVGAQEVDHYAGTSNRI